MDRISDQYQIPNFHGEWVLRENKDRSGQPWLENYRYCSYCGSLHPADFMYQACKSGSGCKIGGSDWKYGYPHKFYVDIPNPNPDEKRLCGSTSKGSKPIFSRDSGVVEKYIKDGDEPGESYTIWDDKRGWSMEGTYPIISCKFYTEHFKDMGLTKQDSDIIFEHTGIIFEIDKKGLKYKAPYHGYQR